MSGEKAADMIEDGAEYRSEDDVFALLDDVRAHLVYLQHLGVTELPALEVSRSRDASRASVASGRSRNPTTASHAPVETPIKGERPPSSGRGGLPSVPGLEGAPASPASPAAVPASPSAVPASGQAASRFGPSSRPQLDALLEQSAAAPSARRVPTLAEEFEARLLSCGDCARGQVRQRPIPGMGPLPCLLMVVTDQGTELEEKAQKPIVGEELKLLSRMLSSMLNLELSQVYLTACLKCRGGSRVLPEEARACYHHLSDELARGRPSLILALGEVAAQTLLRNSLPMSELRGRWHPLSGAQVRVTWHPRDLLRTPDLKRDAFDDLKTVKGAMESATAPS